MKSDMDHMKEYVVWFLMMTVCVLVWFGVLTLARGCSVEASGMNDINMNKIMMIESSGNPGAWNKRDDSRGLYQITPILLKEWNNFHKNIRYSMNDLWNPVINKQIAKWYLQIRIPQMIKYYGKEDTIRNRLIAYNAGISYVKTGKKIPKITVRYLEKYNKH